jgi:hypothetical protein
MLHTSQGKFLRASPPATSSSERLRLMRVGVHSSGAFAPAQIQDYQGLRPVRAQITRQTSWTNPATPTQGQPGQDARPPATPFHTQIPRVPRPSWCADSARFPERATNLRDVSGTLAVDAIRCDPTPADVPTPPVERPSHPQNARAPAASNDATEALRVAYPPGLEPGTS